MVLYNAEKDDILKNYSPKPKGKAYSEYNIFKHNTPLLDVSIIVPCYNSEKYLKECLESVFHQKTKYEYEVIAVNDGSSDSTGEILKNYQEKYSQLRVITQENKGFSGARNTGIRESKGRYLMFLDSDDYLSDNYIECLVKKIKDDDLDIVACGYYTFRNNRVYKKVIPRTSADQNLLNGCFWAKVFRRELFEHIIFPEGYWYEDSILAHLIYPIVKSFSTVDGCQYAYRSNPLGITISSKGKVKAIDSFYITDLMMESVMLLFGESYIKEASYYELIIEQCYLNHRRVSRLSEECQRIIFNNQAQMINALYQGYNCKSKTNARYEKALKEKDFVRAKRTVKLYRVYS